MALLNFEGNHVVLKLLVIQIWKCVFCFHELHLFLEGCGSDFLHSLYIPRVTKKETYKLYSASKYSNSETASSVAINKSQQLNYSKSCTQKNFSTFYIYLHLVVVFVHKINHSLHFLQFLQKQYSRDFRVRWNFYLSAHWH